MEFRATCFEIISCILFAAAAALVLIKFLRGVGAFKSDFSLKKSFVNLDKIGETLKQNETLRVLLTIVFMVLISRLVIYMLGYMALLLTKNENVGFFTSFQTVWNKWDSPHYISIATDGYVNVGDARNFLVFFPLYPALIKLVAFVVRNYYFAGILVSNISLIVACFYMYRLARENVDEPSALRAIKYMLIYPFSFFFGIVYTESLFIALTIMTFYYVRKRNWLIAGICGFFTVLTRNQGILILVPAIVEYLIYIYETRTNDKNNIIKNGLSLLIIPLGMLVYLFINKKVTGEWFEFLKIQKDHWHNSFGFFGENLRNHFMNMSSNDASMRVSLWAPQVITFIFIIVLIFYGIKKLRVSYTAYMLAYLLISFSPTWLLSGPRYISGLFPIYILLAIATKNRVADSFATIISSMLLGFYTIAFAIGATVM